jgi:Tol biopolymer transport system component
MKRRLILLMLVAILWLMVSCGDQPSPTPSVTASTIQPTDTSKPTEIPPTLTPTKGKPAWLPVPPESPTIIQLTDNPGWLNDTPMWSPDGRQILYRSNRECVKQYGDSDEDWGMKSRCEWELYIMDADGSNETRLTDIQFQTSVSSVEAKWSPDGERIAILYSAYLFETYQRVLTFSVRQTRQRLLGLEDMEVLVDKGAGYLVGNFAWSPVGQKYAYDYYNSEDFPYEERWEIVIIDEGNGEEVFRKKTVGNVLCFFRAWSPNGEGILIMCEKILERGYQDDLYWIDVTSGDEKLLIENANKPVWSPDGKWIIYFSQERGRRELLHLESGEIVHLPYRGVIWDIWSWSPDGKWLAITQSPKPENPYDYRTNISLLDMSWLEMEWD